MDQQHIVLTVIGLACAGLAAPVALLAGTPSALALVVAAVALTLHAQLRAVGVARRQLAPQPAVARGRRRARG